MQTESNCKASSIAVVKAEKYVYDSDSQFLELGTNTTLSKKRRHYNLQASTKQAKRKRDHPDGEREIGDRDNMVTVSLTTT